MTRESTIDRNSVVRRPGMLMFSDLLPSPVNRFWKLLRRGLVLAALAVAIGAGAVGSGRNIDRSSARANSAPQTTLSEILQPEFSADTELLHDAVEPQASANIILPEAIAIQPARVHTIQMEVTAYCACPKCCGPNAQGITASGKLINYNDGKFVAADTSVLPFGTKLIIPGYGDGPVEVIDRGGAIKGNKLDVFYTSHEEALRWGRQKITVTVVD
jgi:3D (Asp-Asp-Asp) domain-containing protein